MEHRKHPRITLPLLVELHHPTIGHKRTVARNISEGGVFVALPTAPLKLGSKLKLTLLNPSTVAHQPTPTVDMQVVRVDDDGIACEFVNRTSAHLWRSVEPLRNELEIGRDLFQVHQSAAIVDQSGRLLLIQQQGRWLLPGRYLQVGECWREALESWLTREFGLTGLCFKGTASVSNSADPTLPEAATLTLFHQFTADSSTFRKPAQVKHSRWVDRMRTIEELSFVHEEQRTVASNTLASLGSANATDEPS
jgi:ADP-ribose pyrophosphatase YjhB (NUDIX family)